MPRTWLKTLRKITSHESGCTARVNISVGSRSSFFNSTCAMAAVSLKNATMLEGSAKAAGCGTCAADVTVVTSFLHRASGILHKNIVERRRRPQRGLQIRGFARHGHFPQVHQR